MKQEKKLEYVNYVLLNKNADYQGPSSLFKCRNFDEYTFDMLENNYLYLCVAERLDDETECLTTLDIDNLYDVEKDNLKAMCVFKIMDNVKPYTSEENYERINGIIGRILNGDGTIEPRHLLAFQSEIKELAPGINVDHLINYLLEIPKRLDNPEINEKMKLLISIAKEARGTMKICALCEEPNNKDVWKRYGGDGSGYCVEYDMTGFNPANMVYPVLYADERNTDIVLSLIASFIGQTIIGMTMGQIKPDVSQFLKLFITKNKQWECQNEWRIISDEKDRIGSPKINRIIVGKKATEENRLKMAEFCKRRNIPLEDQD